MEYEVVYDAANQNLDGLDFIAMGLLFVAVGAILVFSEKIRNFLNKRYSKEYVIIFSKIFFGFSLFWTLLAGLAVFHVNGETKLSSKHNSCTSIDGVVENFEPMPYSGHQLEKFEVNNIEFKYSNYVLTGGFNNTASHGGPIFEGRQVRICYFKRPRTNKNIIVRLEVLSK